MCCSSLVRGRARASVAGGALVRRKAGVIRLARRNPVVGIVAIFAGVGRGYVCWPLAARRGAVMAREAGA